MNLPVDTACQSFAMICLTIVHMYLETGARVMVWFSDHLCGHIHTSLSRQNGVLVRRSHAESFLGSMRMFCGTSATFGQAKGTGERRQKKKNTTTTP